MECLAMYLRLSIEDEGDKDESNSISNQRKQIYEYIHHDSELSRYEVVEFCDDGYSGTNMDRPGMQKMLKEVKANKIQCIIVKDMSRFSRDYIEMGTYLWECGLFQSMTVMTAENITEVPLRLILHFRRFFMIYIVRMYL